MNFPLKKQTKNSKENKTKKTFAFSMLVYTQVLKPGLLPQVLSSNLLNIIWLYKALLTSSLSMAQQIYIVEVSQTNNTHWIEIWEISSELKLRNHRLHGISELRISSHEHICLLGVSLFRHKNCMTSSDACS